MRKKSRFVGFSKKRVLELYITTDRWGGGEIPVYNAALVQVEDCGEELANEGTRSTLAKTTILLALDVCEQFTAAGVLRHQTVQGRRLHHHHHN